MTDDSYEDKSSNSERLDKVMEDNRNNAPENQEQEQEKLYTQAEFQSEVDRRVSQALATQKKKFDEASRLANMSEDEQRDYKYNQKMQELEEREAELAKRELSAEAAQQLSKQGLPVEAVDFVVGKDAETTLANIKAFKTMFDNALSAEVSARIATGKPNAATNNNQSVTKEEFRKMNLAQQSHLYQTNPELYKALTE